MRRSRALVNLAVFVSILAFVLTLAPSCVQAQFENYTWYFGMGLGLDFSTKPPTVIRNGKTASYEGTASISDPNTGKILFYTDGVTVWDRTNTPMPDGNGLASDISSTQAALIIPDPANGNRYYIFTADQTGYRFEPRGINYSTVDMTRNGGLGDIVDKNVPLLARASEKLTAVKICHGSAYWVIGHEFFNDRFFAWKVDAKGVSPPVISTVGTVHGPTLGDGIGWMTASPDGTMLGLAFYERTQTPGNVEMFHFDVETGKVSDPILLRRAENPYGICFSPSSRKVYVTSVGQLEQFDVTNWDAASMYGSWETLPSISQENGAIKLGPDGKLYVQHNAYMGTVSFPELRGVQCQYVENVYTMNSEIQWGLPNNVDAESMLACGPPDAQIKLFPDTLCERECLDFFDSSRYNPTSWKWEFEGATPGTSTDKDPKHICFTKEGTYKISLIASNENGSTIDSALIVIRKCLPPDVSLRDTTFCVGNCITFVDTSTNDYDREWTFDGGTPNKFYGDTPPPVCFDNAGTFKVRLVAKNEWGADTAYSIVTVDACPWPVARSEYDTVVCAGEPVDFTDRSANDPTSWEWLFDGASPSASTTKDPQSIVYDIPGYYQIRQIARNANGVDTSFTMIHVKECKAPESKLYDQELCEGDCIVLLDSSKFEPITWEWQITPRLQTFSVKDPGRVCFDSAGEYHLRLITTNDRGSDTATSTILVHGAVGRVSQLDDLSIMVCESLDTFLMLYSGCKDLNYYVSADDDPSISMTTRKGSIPANDSVRILFRIGPKISGPSTSNISVVFDADTSTFPIQLIGLPDAEHFYNNDYGAFSALACEPAIQSIYITNGACADHVIASATIEPPNAGFSLPNNTLPITLHGGEDAVLDVLYDASIAGTSQAELVVTFGSGEQRRYPLSGTHILPESGLVHMDVTGPTSLLPNTTTAVRLSFEQKVLPQLAPEVLEIGMKYNTDLISASSFDVQDGWTLVSKSEQGGDLTFRLARAKQGIQDNAPIVAINFKSFVTSESSTPLTLDRIRCNPNDPDFERCVLELKSSNASEVAIIPICGTPEFEQHLSNAAPLSVIVQPHPVRKGDELKMTVQATETLKDQTLSIRLIDLLGRTTQLHLGTMTSISQSLTLPLPGVSSGVYTLQIEIGSEMKQVTLVVE